MKDKKVIENGLVRHLGFGNAPKDEAQAAVRAAIRALPGGDSIGGPELHSMAWRIVTIMRQITEEKASFKQASPKASAAQLEKTERLARALAKHLADLDGPVRHALSVWSVESNPEEMAAKASALAESAARREVKDMAHRLSQARQGRPNDGVAFMTAYQCALAYWRATGKRPSRIVDSYEDGSPERGPYLQLVKEVFRAMGITASPEATTRRVMEEMQRLS